MHDHLNAGQLRRIFVENAGRHAQSRGMRCDDVWGVRPVELVERTVFVKIDALFSILFFRVLIELLLPNFELLLLRQPHLVWPKICTASVGRKKIGSCQFLCIYRCFTLRCCPSFPCDNTSSRG